MPDERGTGGSGSGRLDEVTNSLPIKGLDCKSSGLSAGQIGFRPTAGGLAARLLWVKHALKMASQATRGEAGAVGKPQHRAEAVGCRGADEVEAWDRAFEMAR